MISLLLRLKRFCGFLFGIVFFTSGLLKLMDPVGAGLIMKEYYSFLHIGFMDPTAKFAGTALALLEAGVGAALVSGVWRRIIGLTAVIMQCVFTLLTALLVIFNPQMDCGCFGEAIHLTHMQTFVKNLILLALILLYYIPKKHLGETKKRKYVSFGIVMTSTVAFMVYSLISIPPIDFTAYKPGIQLQAAAAEGGEDIYEAVFTYSRDGRTEEFTLEGLPDSTWTFVSTQTRIKDGYKESTAGLSIYDPRTGSYADDLACDGKVMVISVYKPHMNERKWEKVRGFMDRAGKAGFSTLLLATDTEAIPEDLRNIAYTSDYKTLISLNRSNGGVTFFNDGTLISKWSERDAPDADQLKKTFDSDSTESAIDYQSKGSLGFQGFLLYVFAVMLLL